MSTTLCYMCVLPLAFHPHSLTHVWQPVCTVVWVFELWLLFHSRNFPWYFYASQHVSASASSMTRPSPTESQSQSYLLSSICIPPSVVCCVPSPVSSRLQLLRQLARLTQLLQLLLAMKSTTFLSIPLSLFLFICLLCRAYLFVF